MSRPVSSEVAEAPVPRRDAADRRGGTATRPNRWGLPFRPELPTALHESESPDELRGAESSELAWVAAVGARVVGVLRLTRNDEGIARVQRVRIDPEWQHTSVPESLADRALAFCRRAGDARITFALGSAPSWFKTLARRRGLTNSNSAQGILQSSVEKGEGHA